MPILLVFRNRTFVGEGIRRQKVPKRKAWDSVWGLIYCARIRTNSEAWPCHASSGPHIYIYNICMSREFIDQHHL